MRFSALGLVLGATAVARAGAEEEEMPQPSREITKYNGIDVPPLLELTPSNWEEEIKKSKFLFVKHYSPYCPHCNQFAPTWQTLYEYYYTSKPEIENAKEASFTDYYGFRFGLLNCVAYYDLCMDHKVQSYPTSILYQDGKVIESLRGKKNITLLMSTIEPILEKAKPAAPRKKLPYLPEVGGHKYPDPEYQKKLEQEKLKEEAKAAASAKAAKAAKASTTAAAAAKATPAGALGKSIDDITDIADKPAAVGAGQEKKPEEGKKAEDATKPDTKDEKLKDDKPKAEKPLDEKPQATQAPSEDWKSQSTGEKLKEEQKAAENVNKYNLKGESVALTPETFNTLVKSTQDPWFIKFYAPWCSHCKALAPTWEQLGKNMAGKLNIGEVNCEVHSKLCKDVGAKGYPTILFFRGADRSEYRGLRGLGDFEDYAQKAMVVAAGIPDVKLADFKKMESTDEVIFVYFYDHATTTEDFKALEQLPLTLIGRGKIVKTNDPEMNTLFKITTWPRLLVSREGRPTYYTPITPDEMRNVKALSEWMKSVWLPLVPEMTANNARQIMEHRVVALAVLNRQDAENFRKSIGEMKAAASEWMDRQIQEFQLERKRLRDAKQARIEEAQERDDERALRNAKAIKVDMESASRKEVGFAWVDGVFWQRWLQNTYGIDVRDGERLIINEEDRRRYWDSSDTGNHIMVSRTAIQETLDKVVYGPNTLKSKYTMSAFWKIFFDIKMRFIDHPYSSTCFVFIVIILGVSYIRRIRRTRPALFRLDDMGLKDGLLGQNGNHKAD